MMTTMMVGKTEQGTERQAFFQGKNRSPFIRMAGFCSWEKNGYKIKGKVGAREQSWELG